jgi:putative endonuclease
VGATGDIRRRLDQHRRGEVRHTRRYGISRLIYLEIHDRITDAIVREKRIKAWKRAWKIELIEAANPNMAGFGL